MPTDVHAHPTAEEIAAHEKFLAQRKEKEQKRRTKGRPPLWRAAVADRQSPIADERTEQQKAWLDLLKLEYDKGADRYENIYKAVWQHFSYMAVVSAGILTFMANKYAPGTVVSLVCLPLLFWVIATFVPMDNYGEDTRDRMAEIEGQINDLYFPAIGDPQIVHYSSFRSPPRGLWHIWRVKYVVRLFGVVLFALVLSGWMKPEWFESRPASNAASLTVRSSADSTNVTVGFRKSVVLEDSIRKLLTGNRALQLQMASEKRIADSLRQCIALPNRCH